MAPTGYGAFKAQLRNQPPSIILPASANSGISLQADRFNAHGTVNGAICLARYVHMLSVYKSGIRVYLAVCSLTLTSSSSTHAYSFTTCSIFSECDPPCACRVETAVVCLGRIVNLHLDFKPQKPWQNHHPNTREGQSDR